MLERKFVQAKNGNERQTWAMFSWWKRLLDSTGSFRTTFLEQCFFKAGFNHLGYNNLQH